MKWNWPFYAAAREESGGRALVLVVIGLDGDFFATAVEMATSDADADPALTGVPTHAHHVIGRFDDDVSARLACEVYAAAWLAGREPVADCQCGEIAVPDVRAVAPEPTE